MGRLSARLWSARVRYLMLVKMNDATATSAVQGFSAALNSMPLAVRKSMTYDQGREMAKHAEITQNTGVTRSIWINQRVISIPARNSNRQALNRQGVAAFRHLGR